MRITKKDIRLSIYAFLLAFTAAFLTSCETENYEFGDVINPSNLAIAADIVGADTENPYGDGSGTVNFTAVADDAITYKFVYNGTEYMQPSGVFTMDFTTTGIHIYEVAVVASGTAGIMTNGSIEVEVLVTYEPQPELVNALTTGSWRVKAKLQGIWVLDRLMIKLLMVWLCGGMQILLIKLILACMMIDLFLLLQGI